MQTLLILLATPFLVWGAEFPDMGHLTWDDPVWYSEDGSKWHQANFVHYSVTTSCRQVESENTTELIQPSICDQQNRSVGLIWYDKPDHPESLVINYVQPNDPTLENPPDKPTKAELYGLLTRLENLLKTQDPRSTFSTAEGMMKDRELLLQRIEVLREILKQWDGAI